MLFARGLNEKKTIPTNIQRFSNCIFNETICERYLRFWIQSNSVNILFICLWKKQTIHYQVNLAASLMISSDLFAGLFDRFAKQHYNFFENF